MACSYSRHNVCVAFSVFILPYSIVKRSLGYEIVFFSKKKRENTHTHTPRPIPDSKGTSPTQLHTIYGKPRDLKKN